MSPSEYSILIGIAGDVAAIKKALKIVDIPLADNSCLFCGRKDVGPTHDSILCYVKNLKE